MRWRLSIGLGLLPFLSCVSKQVQVPTAVPLLREATVAELIERVNERQRIQTLTAQVDLQFETLEKAEKGEARRFRKADGRLLLARPALIRLQIQLPLLKTSLAEMASDGERFQLLVNPSEYRAFIEGSTRGDYSREAQELDSHPELKKAGPLINIRPQHVTEAFLFEPIREAPESRTLAVMHESREIEDDRRPGAKRGQRVLRSYYVLQVIEHGELHYRYWFDGGARELPLTRKQVFGPGGRLVADLSFAQYGPENVPTVVRLERPQEAYSLTLTLSPGSIVVNRELLATVFSVKIPADWEESIRRINLEARP